MLRLFLALHLLFITLYACKGGYTSCIQKAKDANIVRQGLLCIPLQHKQDLIYSQKTPQNKIIKYDPFLGLYLIEDKKAFAYPYSINMRLQLGSAVLNEKDAKEGRYLLGQLGLNRFAKYNRSLGSLAIISSSCCSLEGIVTQKGVIQKEYIQHFLDVKDVIYGDIGIRLDPQAKDAVVEACDPYIPKNPFQKGDVILAFDNEKVSSPAVLMQRILFSKIGTKHHVYIQRAKSLKTLHVTTTRRYGGGFVSDTFLERKGIYFDEKLQIRHIENTFKNYGLHVGDRLIQVNVVRVKSQKELRKYIENFKDYSSLLFERNKFQFFVNIK